MNKYVLIFIFSVLPLTHFAAEVSGIVEDTTGEPLIGAEVLWQGTGIGTVTDVDGFFSIETIDATNKLQISYLGYTTAVIIVDDPTETIVATLVTESEQLSDVTVTARAVGTVTSRITAVQTQKITGAELCKAACCNLSESFETNASVDVAYSDAATGAKQIRMLGLSGNYVQMLSENTPGIRGLASSYGLEYIPGSWMESIQISKGTASVLNGYEATTGQINVEYLKPQITSPIALNAMFNSELCAELNATGGWNINDKLATGVMLQYRNESMEHDQNNDGFMDMPKGNRINLLNRWYYKNDDYVFQFLVRGLYDDRQGGQTTAWHNANPDKTPYDIDIATTRIDGFMKNGYVFNSELGTNIGIVTSGSYHRQNGLYGATRYNATQGTAYLNAIFQTYFDTDSRHKLTAGLSFNYDYYDELLATDRVAESVFDQTRNEFTPGLFAEYDFKYDEKLSLLVGVRADWSNYYGFFCTPRFNLRYSPWTWWNLRASVGLGYRSPNVLTDNAAIFASNRQIVLTEERFAQERAINAGISTTFYIPLGSKELQLSADYYYTHFFECVVADMDSDPHSVIFSNLNDGRAYAGNFQAEASMEILRGWTMTLAYRMSDVKQTIGGQLREKPLTNRFKGLITTSYQTPLKKWQFDVTAQFNGGGRLPDPDTANPLWNSEFKWYPQLMAQITYYGKTWSIYVGAENMTNFKQQNPVIGSDNPFGADFDASMAWGPITGAKAYIGFRWALDRKD
ncbi:MAG: TonB-dependent receptor domain-containing protein [Paludibacteraceae bacterium]